MVNRTMYLGDLGISSKSFAEDFKHSTFEDIHYVNLDPLRINANSVTLYELCMQ